MIKDCSDILLWWMSDAKLQLLICFAMFPIFLTILKVSTDQKLFWHTTLMSVRRKALQDIMFHYVSEFTHHPKVLYRSKTVLIYFSDEFQTQSFGSTSPSFLTILNFRQSKTLQSRCTLALNMNKSATVLRRIWVSCSRTNQTDITNHSTKQLLQYSQKYRKHSETMDYLSLTLNRVTRQNENEAKT